MGVDLTTDFWVLSAQCGALRLGYTIAVSARDHLALGMSRYLAVLEFSFFPYAGLVHAKRLLVEIVPGCRECGARQPMQMLRNSQQPHFPFKLPGSRSCRKTSEFFQIPARLWFLNSPARAGR